MKRKVKYTITTDPAIDRVRLSIDQIAGDSGTTAREKADILRELREYIQQHELACGLAAGEEASRS